MQYPLVSLVIPCYNEKDRIDIMLRELRVFLTAWPAKIEVIIVDDGSTDGTSTLIKNHPLYVPNVMQVLQQPNTGKGGALQLGVRSCNGDFILTLDADMATSPMTLFDWLKDTSHFDATQIWIGSREINKELVQDKKYREFIGHVFNAIIQRISGLKLQDTQCGFKLYPAPIGKKLFDTLQTKGWAHDVEILVNARNQGIPVVEKPVQWTAVAGSKIHIVRDSWNMFWEVIRIGRGNKGIS